MEITDYSKEQVLLGVQKLRTMANSAAAASNMGSPSVATDLSISISSSSARPIRPSPSPAPLQLDLLPLYPSTASLNSSLQHSMSSPITKLLFPKGPFCVGPSPLQATSSPLAVPAARSQAGAAYHPLLLQAGLSVSPCLQTSKAAGSDVGDLIASVAAPRGIDIDVNQVPSSSESDDEEGGEEGAYPPLLLSDSIANNGLQQRGSFSGVDGSSPVSLKREREKVGWEITNNSSNNMFEVSSRASDEEEGTSTRKKLRLSKEQSALLEESFKEHSTLNPKQKNVLAKQLNLRPRQVEVWFQNRRARTKLKQTEVDCELLKRCCESLTEENRRLQKEVQELRALKVGAPCVIAHDFYMPVPAATLTMCPSCERLATLDPVARTSARQHLPPALAFNQHNPQPSAAC